MGPRMAGRNHPARRAAGFDLIRLHHYDQPAVTIIFNIEQVHAGNIKYRIGSGAPARRPHIEWVTVGSFAKQELGRL
jgi:hypothetical protein